MLCLSKTHEPSNNRTPMIWTHLKQKYFWVLTNRMNTFIAVFYHLIHNYDLILSSLTETATFTKYLFFFFSTRHRSWNHYIADIFFLSSTSDTVFIFFYCSTVIFYNSFLLLILLCPTACHRGRPPQHLFPRYPFFCRLGWPQCRPVSLKKILA